MRKLPSRPSPESVTGVMIEGIGFACFDTPPQMGAGQRARIWNVMHWGGLAQRSRDANLFDRHIRDRPGGLREAEAASAKALSGGHICSGAIGPAGGKTPANALKFLYIGSLRIPPPLLGGGGWVWGGLLCL